MKCIIVDDELLDTKVIENHLSHIHGLAKQSIPISTNYRAVFFEQLHSKRSNFGKVQTVFRHFSYFLKP